MAAVEIGSVRTSSSASSCSASSTTCPRPRRWHRGPRSGPPRVPAGRRPRARCRLPGGHPGRRASHAGREPPPTPRPRSPRSAARLRRGRRIRLRGRAAAGGVLGLLVCLERGVLGGAGDLAGVLARDGVGLVDLGRRRRRRARAWLRAAEARREGRRRLPPRPPRRPPAPRPRRSRRSRGRPRWGPRGRRAARSSSRLSSDSAIRSRSPTVAVSGPRGGARGRRRSSAS